jgi:hypothetical protein
MTTPVDAPAPRAWRVETPRPADRGLVVRLLEQVVAADGDVAPEVASGAQRPGPWLQRVRPTWSGVVVDPAAAARCVVGYAAVVPVAGGHALQDVLVAPGADAGVDRALRAAASAALASLRSAPPAAAGDLTLEVGEVTYPAERVPRRRGRAALVGAAVIAALGTAGVLAVQVGVTPFGGALPFLSPDGVDRTVRGTGADPTPAASTPTATTAAPQAVLAAGQPLQPLPQPSSGGPTGAPGPTSPTSPGSPSDGPTSTPTDPPQPPPGPTSSLLDPVVTTVVDTVDGLTGGALSPVTGTVEATTDGLTDTLDDLLPPLGR